MMPGKKSHIYLTGILLLGILVSPETFAASNHKEIYRLQEEKKYLVSLYQRNQKKSDPEDLSGVTLRLNEIQNELDALTGGRKFEDQDHNKRRRNMGSNRSY